MSGTDPLLLPARFWRPHKPCWYSTKTLVLVPVACMLLSAATLSNAQLQRLYHLQIFLPHLHQRRELDVGLRDRMPPSRHAPQPASNLRLTYLLSWNSRPFLPTTNSGAPGPQAIRRARQLKITTDTTTFAVHPCIQPSDTDTYKHTYAKKNYIESPLFRG